MKKIFIIILGIFIISLVSADTISSNNILEFKFDKSVNYRFRCFDENNNYCNSNTQLLINVEYPDGSNALNNVSMTYNETFFNVTLPTNKLGDYNSIIFSPTSANTTTEFIYRVSETGFDLDQFPIPLFLLILGFALIGIGYISMNLRIFKTIGSVILMVVGTYTIYPGYAGINFDNVLGVLIAIISIGGGFYFLVEGILGGDRKQYYGEPGGYE